MCVYARAHVHVHARVHVHACVCVCFCDVRECTLESRSPWNQERGIIEAVWSRLMCVLAANLRSSAKEGAHVLNL